MTKHSHYHKDVTHLKSIDVYRTLELFGVTDQALGHAIKKLLCAGKRGAGKTFEQDVREAVDTLNRRLQMLAEDDAPKAFEASGLPSGFGVFEPGKTRLDKNYVVDTVDCEGRVTYGRPVNDIQDWLNVKGYRISGMRL